MSVFKIFLCKYFSCELILNFVGWYRVPKLTHEIVKRRTKYFKSLKPKPLYFKIQGLLLSNLLHSLSKNKAEIRLKAFYCLIYIETFSE